MGRGFNCKLLVMCGHPCKLAGSLLPLQEGGLARGWFFFFLKPAQNCCFLQGWGGGRGRGRGRGRKKEHDPISGDFEIREQMGGIVAVGFARVAPSQEWA